MRSWYSISLHLIKQQTTNTHTSVTYLRIPLQPVKSQVPHLLSSLSSPPQKKKLAKTRRYDTTIPQNKALKEELPTTSPPPKSLPTNSCRKGSSSSASFCNHSQSSRPPQAAFPSSLVPAPEGGNGARSLPKAAQVESERT